MSGKTFLDTNIVVYLYSGDEPEKRAAALALIKHDNSIVSTQVLSELANTLTRKLRLSFDVVAQAVAEVRDACTVVPVMPDTGVDFFLDGFGFITQRYLLSKSARCRKRNGRVRYALTGVWLKVPARFARIGSLRNAASVIRIVCNA